MSILDWFRARQAESATASPSTHADTETVRRIMAELETLEPARARFLAAFAYLLGRVARADLNVSEAETTRMVEIVERVGGLPEAQSLVVVEIAKHQNRLFGGTEDFLVTREFREISSDAQRQELLECLFAVSAADDAISSDEDAQIWQIASALGIEHAEYIRVRITYASKLTLLRDRQT